MPPRLHQLLRWVVATAWAGVTAAESTAARSPPPPAASISNCPSRTINYITETLPQQCLRTDWSSNATSVEPPNNGYIIVTTDEAGSASTVASLPGGDTPSTSTPMPSEQEASASDAPESAASEATSVISGAPSASSATENAAEQEEDPLSDAANFVSFEEWKAKMLEKAGQSPENIGTGHKTGTGEGRRQPGEIHQALDSLGDDAEIELDFGSFVDPDTVASALPSAKIDREEEKLEIEPDAIAAGLSEKSKNAGTTSKERFNYASVDCAASVLKTNSECKGSNYILGENKDSYMLNPCSVKNKFFIVELCDEILIDTIALANYEFFSSTFRQIRFSISVRYPVQIDKWRELGVFEAQNRRGMQAFLVKNGLDWVRYLRIEFLGHYGAEYYCPVSLLRVHGTTMIDGIRNTREEGEPEKKSAKGNGQQEPAPDSIHPKPAAAPAPADRPASTNGVSSGTNASEPVLEPLGGAPGLAPNTTAAKQSTFPLSNCRGPGAYNDTCPRTNYFSPLLEQTELLTSSCKEGTRFCNMELAQKVEVVSRASSWIRLSSTSPPAPPQSPRSEAQKTSKNSDAKKSTATAEPTRSSEVESRPTSPHRDTPSPAAETEKSKSETKSAANSASSSGAATSDSTTHATSRTQAAPASTPSTQESFFQSIHKRLSLLEANSTLSLQYIEEQSRLLREAFTKVEKRQLAKTTTFLASLNATVLSELREFRTQYDQIWQSTILELSAQREQSVREAGALSARLTILAEEVVWQKRLVYLQFGLLLLGGALFAFVQSPAGTEAQRYLELPALRDILMRSPPGSRANTARYGRRRPRASTAASLHDRTGGPFESPPSSPSRPVSRSGLSWTRMPTSALRGEDGDGAESDETTPQLAKSFESGDSLSKSYKGAYQSPTPPPEGEDRAASANVEGEHVKPNGGLLVPGPEAMLRRAISSPALGEMQTGSDDEDDITSPTGELPRVADLAREDEPEEGLRETEVSEDTTDASLGLGIAVTPATPSRVL